MPTERTGKYNTTTTCIFEIETDEILSIQNPQLIMLPTVHLKDEIEQEQVPITFIDLSPVPIWVAIHTTIESLHADYQDLQGLKILQLVVEQSDTTLCYAPPSAKFVYSVAEVNKYKKNQSRPYSAESGNPTSSGQLM